MSKTTFDDIKIWQPAKEPVRCELLLPPEYLPEEKEILDFAYQYTQLFYSGLPRRKNKDKAFIHPTWTARFIVEAGGKVEIILAGLLHDIIEEAVDKHLKENKITDFRAIRDFERTMRHELGKAFQKAHFFKRGHLARRSLQLVWILTRLKRDDYYKSLRGIFLHRDPAVRVTAATVKLADRLHNINCLECFPRPSDKLYQCYKNLFVLNNAKNLLIEVCNEKSASPEIIKSLAKLIKKCGKGSYQAVDLFLAENKKKLNDPEIYIYLSLALRKYVLEEKGIWQVTKQQLTDSSHPSALFDGILLKYHRRLRKQSNHFLRINETGKNFIKEFFEELNLPDNELETIVYLKDALALREIFASLLYLPDYTITGFCFSKGSRKIAPWFSKKE